MKAIFFTLLFSVTTCVATDKVVCYYGEWSVYRGGDGRFDVEDIDAALCTHLIYGFAGLDETKLTIKILDEWNALQTNYGKGAYARFVALKNKNPSLKTLLAIGGWNEGSTKYSDMASSATTRRTFIDSAVSLLQEHGFDGLDLDWEYPALRGGVARDKDNFVLLIKEAREVFDTYGLLLTAAVGAGKSTVDTAYDVPNLSKYLDFINLMTYDLHGSWEGVTGHNAPLYARSDESAEDQTLNVDYAVKYWLSLGAAPEKLVLGIGLYGRTFTLSNPSVNGLGAPITGGGTVGPYTDEVGYMGYNEICEKLLTGDWSVVWNTEQRIPYAYSGDQWVGYDNSQSVTEKVNYAKAMGLGGAMVWSIDTDDFLGKLTGTKFPLLTAINNALSDGNADSDSKITPTVTASTKSDGNAITEAKSTTSGEGLARDQSASDDECTSSGYFRSAVDCSQFYVCYDVGGLLLKATYDCPAETVFDTELQVCQWKYLVNDCNGS
jgi:chitinase